jgi:hypothetical protein
MSSNPHRKQAKQQKRRTREKEVRKARNISQNISLRDYALQLSRGQWCNCYESGHMGISNLICVRRTYTGYGASVFLLDEYCLGIKDADILRDVELSSLEEQMMERDARVVSPAYALKKITALIAWARQIGFDPHAKTYIAMEIFRGIEPDDCHETFSFGRPEDGQPMYISGPFDSPDRIRSILSKLQKLGPDSHSFAVGIDDSLRRSLLLDMTDSQEPALDVLRTTEDKEFI